MILWKYLKIPRKFLYLIFNNNEKERNAKLRDKAHVGVGPMKVID